MTRPPILVSASRSTGRRLIGAMLAVIVVVVGGAAASSSARTVAMADTAPCTDVMLILADGSGQQGPEQGPQMAAVRDAFVRAMSGSWTDQVVRLPYAAAGAERLFAAPDGITDFLDSIVNGTQNLHQLLEDAARQCPSQQFVLAGYSQGAMVIHQVLDDWAATDPGVLDRIDGVALVADGDRMPDDRSIQLGSALPSATGVWAYAAGLGLWPFPTPGYTLSALRSRTVDVCDQADLVCDTTPARPGRGYTVHTTHYASETRRAGQLLAGFAMGYPSPAPTQQAIAAVQGIPLRAALSFKNAKLRGTLRLVQGSLPPGIVMDQTLAPGRPTFTGRASDQGVWNVVVRVQDTPAHYPPVDIHVTITVASPQISPSSLPTAQVGADFGQQLTVDLPGAVSWSLQGALPAGLALSPTGNLSGRPTAEGTTTFGVTATARGRRVSTLYTLVVESHWLYLWPSSGTPQYYPLPTGLRDAPVSQIAQGFNTLTILYADGRADYWYVVQGGAPFWATLPIDTTQSTSGPITKVDAGGAYITDGSAVYHWLSLVPNAVLAARDLQPGETGFVDVSGDNTSALALTDAGRVILGVTSSGGLPTGPIYPPAELAGQTVVSIYSEAGADYAVTSTGRLVIWSAGGVSPTPTGLCPAAKVRAHGLVGVVCQDGTVQIFGGDPSDSRTNVPPTLTDAVDVAIGDTYAMALTRRGTIFVWGANTSSVPNTLTHVKAVSAGSIGAAGR